MFFRKLLTFSPYFTQMSLNSALVQIILQAKKLWPKKTVLFKQQVKNENEIKYSKATLTELDDPVEEGFSLKPQSSTQKPQNILALFSKIVGGGLSL